MSESSLVKWTWSFLVLSFFQPLSSSSMEKETFQWSANTIKLQLKLHLTTWHVDGSMIAEWWNSLDYGGFKRDNMETRRCSANCTQHTYHPDRSAALTKQIMKGNRSKMILLWWLFYLFESFSPCAYHMLLHFSFFILHKWPKTITYWCSEKCINQFTAVRHRELSWTSSKSLR